MKSTEIAKVVKANEKRRTQTLQDIVAELERISEERELTKSMYFWHPADRAGGRRSNEKKRNISIDLEMKELTIHYKRYYEESCKCVYASDELWADEYKSFTIADIKKILTGLKEVIDRREVTVVQ